VVALLSTADQETLLAKLETRIQSMHETVPEEKRRLMGLRLAEAIAYSAMKRPADVATSLEHLLDLEKKQVEMVGRLCKTELQHGDSAEIRLLLARCYLLVKEPGLAAEQLMSQVTDAEFRSKAAEVLDKGDDSLPLRHVRGVLQLLDGDHDAAFDTLSALLEEDQESLDIIGTVRQTLERVPDARKASSRIRLLYAESLARSGELTRSLQEMQSLLESDTANKECLRVLDVLVKIDPQRTEVRRLRAKVALELGQSDDAVNDLRKAIESGGRARGLKDEIEAAFQKTDCDPKLGKALVDLYLEDEEPQKAVDTLAHMHRLGQASSEKLFELSGQVAGQYGFTSNLVTIFVEAALDIGRKEDARAAMTHYLSSPGARIEEFNTSLSALVQRREDLSDKLATALQDLELPAEIRVELIHARLETGHVDAAVRDLEGLVAAEPRLTRQARDILEDHLSKHEDTAPLLEFLARLVAEQGKATEAAELLARAVRQDPGCSDRVCRQADQLVRQDPRQHDVWRPLVDALMDTGRQRHAREMCFQASHSVAAEQQGFIHVALAQIHQESGQLDAAIQEAQTASECVDVHWGRLESVLRRVIERDPQRGFAHFLLGRTLLERREDLGDAIDALQKAVSLDKVTHEMVLDLLHDHRDVTSEVPEAKVLEGSLRLQKGDRQRGVTLLREALEKSPETSDSVLRALQAQWDRDPDDIETGLALAQALLSAEQLRRACRLLTDLAERFPDHQDAAIAQLQHVLEKKPIAEAHKALWNIHLQKGARDKAIHHVQLALEDLATEPEAYRSLLDDAHRQVPESPWVTCRKAELILAEGKDAEVEQLLRGLLEANLEAVDDVVRVIEPAADDSADLSLLRVDALIAGQQWMPALEALRALRKNFTDVEDLVQERYRVLMDRGDTDLAANVDFGLLLREAGHFEDATSILERTLKLAESKDIKDKEHEVRLALAGLYADLGRETESKQLLASVIDQAEDPSEAYRFIEQVTRKGLVGKLKKLQESITQSPGNLRARLELARLSLVSGDFNTTREALGFAGDSPAIEATRLYLLARSYADDDQPHLAAAVLRSIGVDDVADDELRRNIVYLLAICSELLGHYGEAHARYLRLLSEAPGYKDTHKRARETYQKHLETSLETRALVLEKRMSFEMS
jgi:tetratricopeptide (TPR) repeat protein